MRDALRDAARDDFYPRPPRGGRRGEDCHRDAAQQFLSTPSARRATSRRCRCCRSRPISIHALREEGDRQRGPCCRHRPISIHALREEGDAANTPLFTVARNFYPRPPRGGRLEYDINSLVSFKFLSTPSARRATGTKKIHPVHREISIHALREEGDCPAGASASTTTYFYPRPPRGGRPYTAESSIIDVGFLSTPSARRATRSRQ